MKKIIILCLFGMILLQSCGRYVNPSQVSSIHERQVTPISTDIQHARVGDYVYTEADVYVLEGIELESEVKAKSQNLLSPSFTLRPQSLALSYSSKGNSYYLTDKRKDESVLESLGFSRIDAKGIKISTDGEASLFAWVQHVEYTYPMPTDAKWKKTRLYDAMKAEDAISLTYLGKKDGKLRFNEFSIQNRVKNNLFTSSTKTNSKNTIIEIAEGQSSFAYQDKTISILEATDKQISFRILSNR